MAARKTPAKKSVIEEEIVPDEPLSSLGEEIMILLSSRSLSATELKRISQTSHCRRMEKRLQESAERLVTPAMRYLFTGARVIQSNLERTNGQILVRFPHVPASLDCNSKSSASSSASTSSIDASALLLLAASFNSNSNSSSSPSVDGGDLDHCRKLLAELPIALANNEAALRQHIDSCAEDLSRVNFNDSGTLCAEQARIKQEIAKQTARLKQLESAASQKNDDVYAMIRWEDRFDRTYGQKIFKWTFGWSPNLLISSSQQLKTLPSTTVLCEMTRRMGHSENGMDVKHIKKFFEWLQSMDALPKGVCVVDKSRVLGMKPEFQLPNPVGSAMADVAEPRFQADRTYSAPWLRGATTERGDESATILMATLMALQDVFIPEDFKSSRDRRDEEYLFEQIHGALSNKGGVGVPATFAPFGGSVQAAFAPKGQWEKDLSAAI